MRWLLQAIGYRISFARALTLYMVGHFFNAFMIGVVGGDFIKAYYVSKETTEKRTEVVSTVFIDRIIGLIALVILSVTVMLFRLPLFLSNSQTRVAFFFNLALLGGSTVGVGIICGRDVLLKWPLFRRMTEGTAFGKTFRKVYDAFHTCIRDPQTLIKSLIVSLANHLIFTTAIWLFGTALEVNMSYLDYLSFFPVINAVAAIPISPPGGLGSREVAATVLLGGIGVPESKAVMMSLLAWGTMFIWSLIGGVVYVIFSATEGKAPSGDVVAKG